MDDQRIGLFSTAPVEVLLAAGLHPIDVNNAFVDAPDPRVELDRAEGEGIPRTLCAWTRGLYATTLSLGLRRVLVVTEGDCSARNHRCQLVPSWAMAGWASPQE